MSLVDRLWQDASSDPESTAAEFVNPVAGVADVKSAFDNKHYILMERFAEDAALLAENTRLFVENARVLIPGKKENGTKFHDYFTTTSRCHKCRSTVCWPLLHGFNEGVLQLALNTDPHTDEPPRASYCEEMFAEHLQVRFNQAPADSWRKSVIS